jgi:hypothetical protein
MGNIIHSMKLDYFVLKGNYKIFLVFPYLIALVLGFTKYTYMMGMIVLLISAVSGTTFFSIYEKNHLSKLYGMLPLKRTEAVLGRYLYALLFGILNGIVSGTLTYIFSFVLKNSISPLAFSVSMSIGFLYYCFIIGMEFPILFRFGYSKAYMLTTLPMYLLFIFGLIISKKVDFNNLSRSMSRAIDYFTANPALVWVMGIGAGLVLICISYALAAAVSKRREL